MTRRWAPSLGIAAVTLLVAVLMASPGRAARNLLNNGNFVRGSGDSVDGWRTDAWILGPGTTDYHWIAPQGSAPGEVEIFTHRDNDARWVQGLSLAPGWYHISVEARTVKILPFFTGANISVLEDGIMSADLRRTSGWTRIGFYLRVGGHGADIDLALRLGGYMNLTRGEAFFREPRVVKVLAPPPGARTFDLAAIRRHEAEGPIGHLWTLVATFVAFAALTLVGWRMIVEPPRRQVSEERLSRRKRA